MSAIYQGEFLELTAQDLQTLKQELNPNDEFQQLDLVTENWMDELESRWESDYEPRPLTEQDEEEWLEYENGRLESDLLESEENYF